MMAAPPPQPPPTTTTTHKTHNSKRPENWRRARRFRTSDQDPSGTVRQLLRQPPRQKLSRRMAALVTAFGAVLLLARSAGPFPGYERAHGPNCSVLLIRREMHNRNCFPIGANTTGEPSAWIVAQVLQQRDTFTCEGMNSVSVNGGCAGMFQCGNGAVTMCQSRTSPAPTRCVCDGGGKIGACHRNPYTKSSLCPPGLPDPPMAPPHPPTPPHPPPRPSLPPSPPVPAQRCDRWCHEWFVHKSVTSGCKCGACRRWDPSSANGMANHAVDWEAVKQIERGVPCKNNRLHPSGSSPPAPARPPRGPRQPLGAWMEFAG